MRYFITMTFLLSVSYGYCQTIYSLGDLTHSHADSFCYVVIGDYGDDSQGEKQVADMVKSWHPLFIITTGDNDYEDKNGKSIETNIVQYYEPFIKTDLHANRFFPCLGNHDLNTSVRGKVLEEYFRIFPFLNRSENYDFTWGPVHFYSINSGPRIEHAVIDPDVLADLKAGLATAPEPFHIVFFHHPQYSSAYGAVPLTGRFADYNIDAILNGHIHYYERISDTVRHIEYITIGCSGRNNDVCAHQLDGNKEVIDCRCLDHQNGAIKVTVVKIRSVKGKDKWRMKFDYYNVADPKAPLDTWTLVK